MELISHFLSAVEHHTEGRIAANGAFREISISPHIRPETVALVRHRSSSLAMPLVEGVQTQDQRRAHGRKKPAPLCGTGLTCPPRFPDQLKCQFSERSHTPILGAHLGFRLVLGRPLPRLAWRCTLAAPTRRTPSAMSIVAPRLPSPQSVPRISEGRRPDRLKTLV